MNTPDLKTVVQTKGLTKRYREVTALDDCTLAVEHGEIFGLLGPNGAGKTTLLRLVLGFIRPTTGVATVNGLDCYGNRVDVHSQVAYLPGDARMFRTMRGKDALRFFSDMRAESNLDNARAMADRLELDTNRWVAFMSTGMRQKLALAVCLATEVPIWILDEPTANLDPSVRSEVLKVVAEAKAAGRTVIFSSHVLSEVEDVCDRVAILRSGRLVHMQQMHELKRQHRIRARSQHALPDIPDDLSEHLTITRNGEHDLQIETPDELSGILQWLATAKLSDVYVEPIGLRAVYDRFHSEEG